MGYRNLAECARDLEANGQLRRIDAELDPRLEIAAVQRRAFAAKGPALLFTNPRGCSFPMLANLFGTKERLEFIFRDSLHVIRKLFQSAANPGNLLRQPLSAGHMLLKMASMRPKRRKFSSPEKIPVLSRACNISDLPALVSWPQDAGPFITLPLVYSENPEGGKPANLGMYRVQLSGNSYASDEAGMHYQIHRGIGAHHAKALELGIDLPVHVYVGGPPALTVAAVMPLPAGVNELLFAGLLGGRRMDLASCPGFDLPVLSECDFLLKGRIIRELKPEGPFGDHVGYYSMRHEFPVFKVERVCHRPDAIWLFTTVGRPPQEDTVFGDFIHELTGSLVGKVFEGVREVHAVDAAGVHPLLLAIGSERYAAYEERRKPRELLTLAMHLLGTTQTALAKYLLIAAGEDAPSLRCRDIPAFLRHMLERTDFAADLHFLTAVTADTLDYTGGKLNEGSKLVWASAGPKRRELGMELPAMPDLPPSFSRPLLALPGIIVLQGEKHVLPAGEQDTAIGRGLREYFENLPQREGFPLVVVADDSQFCAASLANFLWTTFTRSDPATDTYGAFAATRAKHWSCQAPLIIDARQKEFHAPQLREDPAVTKRIEALATRGGPLEGVF